MEENGLIFRCFASGSSGNCYYLGTRRQGILIDAGISARSIQKYLREMGLDFHNIMGVLVTHDHADHIRAVGTLGERIHLPTVRAIRHKPTPPPEPPKPKCKLTLIPEEDEKIEPVPNDYEGASIILTRENTEANNRTITSKEQAELINEDGKWFILNKSELGSTYLEASRKLELQPGDIIVLGDRRFKFEPEVTDNK